jgi:hypothetical protein
MRHDILFALAALSLQSVGAIDWQVIPHPNDSREVNESHAVLAFLEDSVWAVSVSCHVSRVGESSQTCRSVSFTLTGQRNRTQQSVGPGPNVASSLDELFASDVTPGGAAGRFPKERTLIEKELS